MHVTMLLIKFMGTCEIALSRMPPNTFNDKLIYWSRFWLGAVRQQVITWANVDPD